MSEYVPVKLSGVVRYLWDTMGNRRSVYLLAFLLALGNTAVMQLTPYVNELYFNRLERGDLENIYLLLNISLIGLLVLIGVHMCGLYMRHVVLTALSRDVMLDTLERVQRLPYDRALRYPSGDLFQRVTYDSGNSAYLISNIIDDIGGPLVAILIAAAYMLHIHRPLALAVLLLMPVALLGGSWLRQHLQGVGAAVAGQEAKVRQTIQEMLQGMETIHAFQASSWFLARYAEERSRLNRLYFRQMWLNLLVEGISSTLSMALIWASVWVMAWQAVRGNVQLGELMAFFILIWRVYNPMVQMGIAWGAIQRGLGAARRIFHLPGMENSAAEMPSDLEVTGERSEIAITLREVGYRYPNEREDETDRDIAVRNVTLEVRNGERVAFIGPSGSGKSTIARLMAGLLRPAEGEVRIFGADPRSANADVAYVPQSTYLFSGTIRQNFLMVKPDATDEEIDRALDIAQAKAFVSQLPDGIDTHLGEGGHTVSGGQRQRLALARALLADRKILILDEATSALDYETEQALWRGLIRWVEEKGITLVAITHRTETVRDFDKIIVVQQGAVLV
jgi:ATP-binding cassette subfamily B protein/subfamily B ATP-binding cassette protein MsbA